MMTCASNVKPRSPRQLADNDNNHRAAAVDWPIQNTYPTAAPVHLRLSGMSIWRDGDPPLNPGRPRESHLERRVWRLRQLEQRRPGKFAEQLSMAKSELSKERRFNDAIDFAF